MNDSIGKQLREAREARSLTLEQVAKATYMRLHYLQALEAGDFNSMPSSTQARGFLRTYANFLGLDTKALLASLDGESVPEPGQGAADEPTREPKPEKIEAASGDAESAFVEVGQRLKKQRETLGLSLDDVERHTNLRQHYLKALEAGDMDAMPSPVQGRGMLNNYAIFLGMDPEPLLIRFAQGLQARLTVRKSKSDAAPKRTHRKPLLPARMRRIFSSDVLIGGTVGIFIVVFVVWMSIRVFAMQSNTVPTTTAPSIADVLIASPSPSVSVVTVTETPHQSAPVLAQPQNTPLADSTIEVPPILSGEEEVEIYLTVHQRAWVRVTVDDEIALVGRVLPGSAYPFSGESQIEILTGNGWGIQVYYNGNDEGRLGNYGQVVNVIYTREGLVVPTPTITPTPTRTPRVTPTSPVLPGAGTDIPPIP